MKLNSLQTYNYSSNAYNSKHNGTPAFKGALSVNFWDAIQRGGFAASFTIQDVLGTGVPRTYQATQRNKDITGKNNYKAAAEVAIREALTGPSMCVIPMAVLAFAKKLSGSATEVPLDNINVFSDEMKNILKKNSVDGFNINSQYTHKVKNDFYEKMFALALGEENGVSEPAKDLADMLHRYDEAPKRGFFKQLLNKDIVDKTTNQKLKSKDQLLSDIVNKFTNIKKDRTDDYSSLLTSNLAGKLKKKNSVNNLIKDFSNFANDVDKTMNKSISKNGASSAFGTKFDSFMDEFKVRRTGSKFITNIAMVVATALFLTQIPKLYTLYETNPETDAIRQPQGGNDNADK